MHTPSILADFSSVMHEHRHAKGAMSFLIHISKLIKLNAAIYMS